MTNIGVEAIHNAPLFLIYENAKNSCLNLVIVSRKKRAKLSVEDALSDRQDAYPTVMRCLIGKIRGFALSRKSCSWRDAEPNRAPECKILELQASEN